MIENRKKSMSRIEVKRKQEQTRKEKIVDEWMD